MPTGYTQDIYAGKDITFREYALTCARAFGAFVTMRDSPMDAELPTTFEPSTYHRDKLDDAARRVQELLVMTQEQRDDAANAKYRQDIERWKKSEQTNYEMAARYDSMLERARKYIAPPGLEEFAKFLVTQLEESKRFDCHVPGESYFTEPVSESGNEWYSKRLAQDTKDVKYHSEEWEKELQRVKERNEWITNLFASLESAPVEGTK